MGLEKGRMIRMDSTVIETHIHEPSDSSLMYDMIRTVNQVFAKMRKELGIKVYGNISTKDDYPTSPKLYRIESRHP